MMQNSIFENRHHFPLTISKTIFFIFGLNFQEIYFPTFFAWSYVFSINLPLPQELAMRAEADR